VLLLLDVLEFFTRLNKMTVCIRETLVRILDKSIITLALAIFRLDTSIFLLRPTVQRSIEIQEILLELFNLPWMSQSNYPQKVDCATGIALLGTIKINYFE